MPGIDTQRPFVPVQIAVLTVSDTRTRQDDRSGDALEEAAASAGHNVVARMIVPDDQDRIEMVVRAWIEDPAVDVVLATGGTGLTGRDVTPEAFCSLYEKEIPGFGELFRWQSYQKIGTSTIQSRATAGVAGSGGRIALLLAVRPAAAARACLATRREANEGPRRPPAARRGSSGRGRRDGLTGQCARAGR